MTYKINAMYTIKFGVICSQNINFVTTVSLKGTGVMYPRFARFFVPQFCFPLISLVKSSLALCMFALQNQTFYLKFEKYVNLKPHLLLNQTS